MATITQGTAISSGVTTLPTETQTAYLETKHFRTIPSRVKAVKDRVLEFIGSTESPDRDNEVVKASAWQVDKYTKNPVVQWAHDYASPPIGRTLAIRQNAKKETIFEIEFADAETYEFADTVYRLCKGGFLNATSVGFIPIEYEKGEKGVSRVYTKVELLEISIVPVPANPDALISARNAGIITTKEFDLVTKPEVTENLIRLPNPKDKETHKGCKIRTMDVTAGIQALYCVDHKIIMTYLFDKEKFTEAEAREWLQEHSKGLKQEELADDIDYLLKELPIAGISDKYKAKAIELSDTIRRLTGCDNPDNIDEPSPRPLLDLITKLYDEHHEAHNKCYGSMKECLDKLCKSLEDGDIGNQPEEPINEQPQNLSIQELVKEEFKKQIGGIK